MKPPLVPSPRLLPATFATGYVPWPNQVLKLSGWYYLGDNWECFALWMCAHAPILTSALAFSFGDHYRRTA